MFRCIVVIGCVHFAVQVPVAQRNRKFYTLRGADSAPRITRGRRHIAGTPSSWLLIYTRAATRERGIHTRARSRNRPTEPRCP
jgi:hypothetical protein